MCSTGWRVQKKDAAMLSDAEFLFALSSLPPLFFLVTLLRPGYLSLMFLTPEDELNSFLLLLFLIRSVLLQRERKFNFFTLPRS